MSDFYKEMIATVDEAFENGTLAFMCGDMQNEDTKPSDTYNDDSWYADMPKEFKLRQAKKEKRAKRRKKSMTIARKRQKFDMNMYPYSTMSYSIPQQLGKYMKSKTLTTPAKDGREAYMFINSKPFAEVKVNEYSKRDFQEYLRPDISEKAAKELLYEEYSRDDMYEEYHEQKLMKQYLEEMNMYESFCRWKTTV